MATGPVGWLRPRWERSAPGVRRAVGGRMRPTGASGGTGGASGPPRR